MSMTPYQKKIAGELADVKQDFKRALADFNTAKKSVIDGMVLKPAMEINVEEIGFAVDAMTQKQALLKILVAKIEKYNAELGNENDPDLLALKFTD